MGIFFTLFYQPAANILFLFTALFNTTNIIIGLLFLLIIVKIILLQPSIKSIIVQQKIKGLQKELKGIQKKYTDKKEQSIKVLELYKREKINPVTSFFVLIIQIPIYIGVFFVLRDIGLKNFNLEDILYNSVFTYTGNIIPNSHFLWVNLFDKGGIWLAIIIGVAQAIFFFYLYKKETGDEKTKKIQKILYTTVVLVAFITPFLFPAIVAMYWLLNTILSFLQEVVFMSKFRKLKIDS